MNQQTEIEIRRHEGQLYALRLDIQCLSWSQKNTRHIVELERAIKEIEDKIAELKKETE